MVWESSNKGHGNSCASPPALLWHILLPPAPQAMCFDIGHPVSCAGRRSFSECCRASWWLRSIAVLLVCAHEALYLSTCAAPCATGSRMLWCSVMWLALFLSNTFNSSYLQSWAVAMLLLWAKPKTRSCVSWSLCLGQKKSGTPYPIVVQWQVCPGKCGNNEGES